MFRLKVCGVTRSDDLRILADAGVDAVGINLVPTSPRCVTEMVAKELCAEARQLGLLSVIVTMDCTREQLDSVVRSVQPDAVQLHGHELPEVLSASLRAMPIVKALSWSGREEEVQLATAWLRDRPARFAFLVDAYAPGVGGGTGKVARWDLLWPRPQLLADGPLLLAGGLTADNVAQAIAVTQCAGVDTASGVESAAGIKDPIKVKRFADEARRREQASAPAQRAEAPNAPDQSSR